MSTSAHEPRAVVLVVEDEPLVRMLEADILDEAGYRVLEAANADEAVNLLEARPDIRLVISDIDMPGTMNGIGLANHLARARPRVPVALISGRVQPRRSELPPEVIFLSKPFDPAGFLRIVATLLDAPSAPREP